MAVSSQPAPSPGGSSPLALLRRLWRQVGGVRRRQLIGVVALMLLAGLFEMVSLAAVLPLLGLLLGPRGSSELMLPLLFALLLLGGAAVRLASFWCHTRLAAAVGSDFSARAFRLLLGQPYAWHLHSRSGALVTTLAPLMRQLVQQVLLQALQLAGASLLLAGLLAVLLVIAWPLVLGVALLLLPAYLLLWRLLQGRLHANGRWVVEAQREQIELLQECLGGIRELILRGWQPIAVDRFRSLDRAMRRREAVNETLTGVPRYLIEPLGLILILAFGLLQQQQGRSPQQVIATLGLLAFAAQRLLPLSQQVWKAWSSLAGGQALIENLLLLLELPEPDRSAAAVAPLPWRRDLRLEGIRFRYAPGTPPVLDGFNLQLRRGEWLGVRGPSGCGKSTLLDVVLGLLTPQAGRLLVDGEDLLVDPERLRAWQRGVATVAARSPLVAGTVASNILVGSRSGDGRLEAVADLTGIRHLLQRDVGDGGRGLSDGQRQRVAIARALFHGGGLLVLDEATAALDTASEAELLGRLRARQPDLAVILVSHRDGSLRCCDRVVSVGGG